MIIGWDNITRYKVEVDEINRYTIAFRPKRDDAGAERRREKKQKRVSFADQRLDSWPDKNERKVPDLGVKERNPNHREALTSREVVRRVMTSREVVKEVSTHREEVKRKQIRTDIEEEAIVFELIVKSRFYTIKEVTIAPHETMRINLVRSGRTKIESLEMVEGLVEDQRTSILPKVITSNTSEVDVLIQNRTKASIVIPENRMMAQGEPTEASSLVDLCDWVVERAESSGNAKINKITSRKDSDEEILRKHPEYKNVRDIPRTMRSFPELDLQDVKFGNNLTKFQRTKLRDVIQRWNHIFSDRCAIVS